MGRRQYGGNFAAVYDAQMREDYSYDKYADYIESVFVKFKKPPTPAVVDLGCGAGALCVELAARGYDMIGVDNSPHMLAGARDRAISSGRGDILFLEQELHAFELYGSVSAFISTFDCLNYITDRRRLRAMFKLVDNYLEPGGLFVFDLNTPRMLKSLAGRVFYNITDDFCYIWRNAPDGKSGRTVFDMTFFSKEKDGRWRREDEIHRQRAYSNEDITRAIAGTRLQIAGVFAFLGFGKPSGNARKKSYIIKKNDG